MGDCILNCYFCKTQAACEAWDRGAQCGGVYDAGSPFCAPDGVYETCIMADGVQCLHAD